MSNAALSFSTSLDRSRDRLSLLDLDTHTSRNGFERGGGEFPRLSVVHDCIHFLIFLMSNLMVDDSDSVVIVIGSSMCVGGI